MPDLSGLNPRQREAVEHTSGPLLVLAGAGSGKTRVITHKIAYLIRKMNMDPRHISAVTFTNKAAREMKQRVKDLLPGKETRGLRVSTFHTLGLNIIRQEQAVLGYQGGFSIMDAQDAAGIVRELMRTELSSDPALAEQVHTIISNWKNQMVAPDSLPQPTDNPLSKAASRLYPLYNRQLKACNAVDFDDLILQPVLLFRNHPDVLDRWRDKIRYLLVDEYQDTNACQYELVRQLVALRGGLTVVGDDDQSIYAWRGAQPENLLQLKQDFTSFKVIKLEQNYRSTQRILKVANRLIDNNPHPFPKKLWSELGLGEPIKVYQARDDIQEAQWVVAQIMHKNFVDRTSHGDFAILYRGNHQSRVLEKVLREHHIPYYLSGGISFFERAEIKDLIAYMRLLANPADNNAFLRIVNTPRRGIGQGTLEALGEYARQRDVNLYHAASELGLAERLNERQLQSLKEFTGWFDTVASEAEQGDPVELVRKLIKDVAYEDWLQETSKSEAAYERRRENVGDLIEWMGKIAGSGGERKNLAAVVADMTLIGILERQEDEEPGQVVSLMTMHAAKGLEFPHVYVVGAEEGILPHQNSQGEDGIREERRLMYVAITRARKTLSISYCAKRRRYGESVECEPSQFLEELPKEDLDWRTPAAKKAPDKQVGGAYLSQLRSRLATET